MRKIINKELTTHVQIIYCPEEILVRNLVHLVLSQGKTLGSKSPKMGF